MKSLQSQFVTSKGASIRIGNMAVIQMDRLPIVEGVVRIAFKTDASKTSQGVALKSSDGKVRFSDGRETQLAYVWSLKDVTRVVECEVTCPSGELRICNIYKVPGSVSEADYWTGNAGMIVENVVPGRNRYRCSDGNGEFDPDDFVFEIDWIEK